MFYWHVFPGLQNQSLMSALLFVRGKRKLGFPGNTSGKKPTCQCRRHKRHGSLPGSGRSPGGGHGNPLQCSCLESPMDRGAWWATVDRVPKSQTWLKPLGMHTKNQASKEFQVTRDYSACTTESSLLPEHHPVFFRALFHEPFPSNPSGLHF